MRYRLFVTPLLVVSAVAGLVAWAAWSPLGGSPTLGPVRPSRDLDEVVEQLDDHVTRDWAAHGLAPAQPADDLTVYRRLSLALHGTVPSLEEIRRFEADDRPDRLRLTTARMLADNRFADYFADYFAERLARVFVGTAEGQFVIFRRDRFKQWLSERLAENTPYDEIVRRMISETGLWTDTPATNFLTGAYNNEQFDENKLAGRVTRAFLGQRLDCAQCHDHPFDPRWKQGHFEGLAAFFRQTRLGIGGVEDRTQDKGRLVVYEVERPDPATGDVTKEVVAPAVPFHEEWLPEEGTLRQRLSQWVTHEDNRRFERATVNRVWGLLFGLSYSQAAAALPVDDLPNPDDARVPLPVLDILGEDFRTHGYDFRRLIQAIAASKAFRLDSSHPTDDDAEFEQLKQHWAVFPLTRLRPEQSIGSMMQAASIKTIDRNSHLIVRFLRLVREGDFIREYGDLGENELEEHAGTIPQALLRMNGKLTGDTTEANLLNASGRIVGLSNTDARCLETTYLVCLTRRPTPEERAWFLAQLGDADNLKQRARVVEDLIWSLYNSPEFSWNH